jgi:methanol corrinoid protein
MGRIFRLAQKEEKPMVNHKGIDYTKILKRYDIDAQNNTSPQAIADKMLPKDPVLRKVAETVVWMKFKEVGPATMEALNSKDPLAIINDGLVVGMEVVAKLYADHIYYLPEIMMAAKTMEIGIAIAEKKIAGGRETK